MRQIKLKQAAKEETSKEQKEKVALQQQMSLEQAKKVALRGQFDPLNMAAAAAVRKSHQDQAIMVEKMQAPISLQRVVSQKDLDLSNIELHDNGSTLNKQKQPIEAIPELINDNSSCTPKIMGSLTKKGNAVPAQELKVDVSLEKIQIEVGDQVAEVPPQANYNNGTQDSGKKNQQHQVTRDAQTADTNATKDRPSLNQQRNNNNESIITTNAVFSSPIGTVTSFKSQPPHQTEVQPLPKFPMKPEQALKHYAEHLTDYEKEEIFEYPEVYYLGQGAPKIKGSPANEHNYGYDDEKGDFKLVIKDHIGFRYEIQAFLGKGSFGIAIQCFDHKLKELLCVKVVKNKKKYQYQAGIELKILSFLKENDPDDIMNVVHMGDYVVFRKHLCLSFELLSMNLFEFLKVNDFNGFDHNLIRRFAIQLLYALKYLKEYQIIHCDLKPENILLKEPNKSGIKIIDFGSSTFIDERVYTYIQSRFYRAPEIMLGIPYSCAIDMWSFGCIMAELYVGYPIFPGESENDQMSRIFEMIGVPSHDVLQVSQRKKKFLNEVSPNTFDPIMLPNSRGKLRKPKGKTLEMIMGNEDPDFLDFVQQCLIWNPETRMTPDDALRHVWVLKGLPPQVLIHHQRMHNIETPELPDDVLTARNKFLEEMNVESQLASSRVGASKDGGSAKKSYRKQESLNRNPDKIDHRSTERGPAKTNQSIKVPKQTGLFQQHRNANIAQQNQPRGNPNEVRQSQPSENIQKLVIMPNSLKFQTTQPNIMTTHNGRLKNQGHKPIFNFS